MAKEAFRLRAELVERSFALILDRGGMRRAWLRGRQNLHKRYLVHVAGYNLGLIMRKLTGFGTPRGWADARRAAERRLCALWNSVVRLGRRWARVLAAKCRPTLPEHLGRAAA